jgi:L-aminopeptidase/D-esterase-like protein
MRVPVYLDYLMANQLIAAADQRQQVLEAHATRIVEQGGDIPDSLSRAIVDCIAGELALRAAFDVQRDIVAEAPEMHGDIPLALHIYMAEGR